MTKLTCICNPLWQLRVIDDLSALFPATQFIATSHSPLIVQVAEDANLILLEKQEQEGQVKIENYPGVPQNLRVDQILNSLLFGVPTSRSPSVQRLLDQRAELLDKTDRTEEEENLLQDIRRQIDELPIAHSNSDQICHGPHSTLRRPGWNKRRKMIRIERTYPAPPKLLEDGVRQTGLDCSAYDNSPEDYISRRERFPNREYYNRGDVKDLLMEMHHGKCCYCEAKHGRGDFQVEHFRPRGAVRQPTDGRNEYPGYYWLAYSWENLLLACPTCNRKKDSKFPLENPALRARSHHDDFMLERPVFVNPTEEDPRDHVRFLDDAAVPLTERGRQTIGELDLRRSDLTEARLRHISLLRINIKMLKAEPAPNLQGFQQEAGRNLKAALQRDAPFSAMVLDLTELTDTLTTYVEQSSD